MKGIVKRFNKVKGFGFITDENGNDIFFHFSQIVMKGYKDIPVGAKVEFDLVESERGPQAHEIHKIAEQG